MESRGKIAIDPDGIPCFFFLGRESRECLACANVFLGTKQKKIERQTYGANLQVALLLEVGLHLHSSQSAYLIWRFGNGVTTENVSRG